MGIFNFFSDLFTPKQWIENRLALDKGAFYETQALHPNADPHVILILIWMARYSQNYDNPNGEDTQTAAFTETSQFACLKTPDNITAFSIYCIYKERPTLFKKYPEYDDALNNLMMPVTIAIDLYGDFHNLYQLHNPNVVNE